MIPLTKEEEKIHCKQKKGIIYAEKDLVIILEN